MTGLDTVLALLARAGLTEENVDVKTIEYYLRQGLLPHRIVTEIYRIPITAIQPSQEGL